MPLGSPSLDPALPTTSSDSAPPGDQRGPKGYAYLVGTGIAMGAADVVPGVSGGTMAFILGIYRELIEAIKSFDLRLAGLVVRGRLRDAVDHVPWRFLVPLVSGILVSILSLAHAVSWLLENRQSLLYAFFFGLVLASIVAVATEVRWSARAVATLVTGTAVAYWIVGLVPVSAPNTPLIVFGSGVVAISAMILPGISGSFILLILGQYAFILASVKSFDLLALAPFLVGCAVGITGFARVLSWLFAYYQQLTITLLIGFMIGSLRRIWPFKETVETMIDRHGEVVPKVQHNLMPDPASSETWIALGLAILGFVLIWLLDRLRRRLVETRAAA
ncbi:MAG: DUF368 domain-containing protein [Acidobacteriota bacterium]